MGSESIDHLLFFCAISEALVATGVGLAAAIPASVAYNGYITKLKKREVALSNFAKDFLNLAKRNFFQGN